MLFENPSLYNAFINSGDIRVLINLIEKYDYTEEEASEVINIYEDKDKDSTLPEVEHIEVLLSYFPKSKISNNTMNAVKKYFPHRLVYIKKIQNK